MYVCMYVYMYVCMYVCLKVYFTMLTPLIIIHVTHTRIRQTGTKNFQ